jgi:hypothetical protein
LTAKVVVQVKAALAVVQIRRYSLPLDDASSRRAAP